MAMGKLGELKGWFGGKKEKMGSRITMEGLLHQARESFEVFVNSGNLTEVERKISDKLMRYAYGIILLTEVNVGVLMGGGRIGTGIIITRLTTNRWSGPIAVGNMGFSFGPQLGASKVDHVIILPSPECLASFLGKGQLSIKGGTQLTIGNIGRDAQIGVGVSVEGKLAPVTSYSFGAKGLFGGVSIGSVVLAPRNECNTAFYGQTVDLRDITSGHLQPPQLNDDYQRIVELLNVHQTLNDVQSAQRANPFVLSSSGDHNEQDTGFEYQAFDATL